MDSIAAKPFRLRQLADSAHRSVFRNREGSDAPRRRSESEQGRTSRGHGRIRRRRFEADEAYAGGFFRFNLCRFEGTRRGLSEAPDYVLEEDRSNYRSIPREMFGDLRYPPVTFETSNAIFVSLVSLQTLSVHAATEFPAPNTLERSRRKQNTLFAE